MSLKSIILFNKRDESFSIIGFNYNDVDAVSEIANLRKDNLPAFSIDQKRVFTSKEQVVRLLNKKMKEIRDKIQNKKT